MLSVVILAAGQGTRMRSPLPKVLHEAAGKPLLEHVLLAVAPLGPERTVVIVGHQAEAVEEHFKNYPVTFVRQDFSLGYGTGMALRGAQGALAGFEGDLLVLNGDGPLITTETLRALVQAQAGHAGMTLLTCTVQDPSGLGRIVRHGDGSVARIVEEKEATPPERAVREINPGIYVFDRRVFDLSAQLKSDNAAGEFYVTDLVDIYLRAGYRVQAVSSDDETEVLGVNDREQLALAERMLLARG